MLKTAHKILTGIIIALGVLHVLVTFHNYDSFSIRGLWFASAGVAIILAGFLNIVLLRDALQRYGCLNALHKARMLPLR